MKTKRTLTVQLGDLIVATFDKAALHSTDPREVSRLATRAVTHMLRRARTTLPVPRELVTLDGEEHIILREDNVLAILEK